MRALLIGLTLLAGGPLHAEPLGRLFLTPERRAMLERQRQQNVQTAQTLEGTVMSLDGVVTRSSGKTTVWINQHAQHENTVGTGVTAAVATRTPGRVVLTPTDEAPTGVTAAVATRTPGRGVLTPTDETPAPLRVGEAINRGTLERADGLNGGRVTVNRQP